MIFSPKKPASNASDELTSSLFRVVQQLLEGCALHSVEFDSIEHEAFRSAIRGISRKFEGLPDYKDSLILAGEANKTIQAYNQLVERFIRELSVEKQQAVKLLAQSLLRVCNANEKSAGTLRQIELDLGSASQLPDMRDLRGKLAECVAGLCAEAEAQEARYLELKEHLSQSTALFEPRDQVTGLGTLKNAESRVKELSAAGSQGHVMVFFLRNVDVVNRRFGFSAGDEVLKRFSTYLGKSLQGSDELFRWRGPCFVIVTDRFGPTSLIESAAKQLGIRGPEQEVEGGGKSMLIRLMAATACFPIAKGEGSMGLSAKIDQFAAEQFKLSHGTTVSA